MRSRRLVWLALSLMLVPLQAARTDEANETVYVVSYIDVAAPAVTHAAEVLRRIAEAARQAPGAVSFDVLQRIAPENQFAIVEVWKNSKARTESSAAALIGELRADLDPVLIAPLDQQFYTIVSATPHALAGPGAVYAVSHIDILGPNPAGRDAFMPVLEAFSAASRKARGNLRYDLAQQSSRTNHFEAVEVWSNQKSASDHEVSALNRDFRAKLGVASSSPYDRRWYKALE